MQALSMYKLARTYFWGGQSVNKFFFSKFNNKIYLDSKLKNTYMKISINKYLAPTKYK